MGISALRGMQVNGICYKKQMNNPIFSQKFFMKNGFPKEDSDDENYGYDHCLNWFSSCKLKYHLGAIAIHEFMST